MRYSNGLMRSLRRRKSVLRRATSAGLTGVLLSVGSVMAWTDSRVEVPWPGVDAGEIGVDATGRQHIVYESNCEIFYRTNASGGWATGRLRATNDDVFCNVLGDVYVSPQGKVWFTYYSESWDAGIKWKFGTNYSGAWVYKNAVAKGHHSWAMNRDVAIVARGTTVHVVYTIGPKSFGGPDSSLWLRTYKPSGVTTKRLASGLEGYSNTDVALDANGKLHLVYEFEDGPPGVAYATNRSGSWVRTVLEFREGHASYAPQLALDPNGKVHAAWSYCTKCVTPDEVVEVHYSTNASGSFVRRAVPLGGDANWVRIAYSNAVHMTFNGLGELNESEGHYATFTGGTWQLMTWESEDSDDTYGHLSVAAHAGSPYILYSLQTVDEELDTVEDYLGVRVN